MLGDTTVVRKRSYHETSSHLQSRLFYLVLKSSQIRNATPDLRGLEFMRRIGACGPRDVNQVYSDICKGSLLASSYVVKIVEPYANNLLKRLSKQPILHFLDTGLAAYLAGWTNPTVLEAGAMSGQFFETYAFGEVYKSFVNAGLRPPLYFFRNNDKREIDILMERDGTLYPIEVKKTASPSCKDARNLGALDPVSQSVVPSELASFKRAIGTGCILCMAQDTYPVSERAWAFPIWAV